MFFVEWFVDDFEVVGVLCCVVDEDGFVGCDGVDLFVFEVFDVFGVCVVFFCFYFGVVFFDVLDWCGFGC